MDVHIFLHESRILTSTSVKVVSAGRLLGVQLHNRPRNSLYLSQLNESLSPVPVPMIPV